MTNEELRKLLDTGDYVKIARMVGYEDLNYGRNYVYQVISGRRGCKKGKGKEIIEAANVIAERNAKDGKSSKK